MTDFTPTDEQKLLLAHDPQHHGRVMAGPGTGKSVTLVALLDDLLKKKSDLRVRLLTFTRAATSDLAKKVSEHPDVKVTRPSTIHSFSISVLLQNPGAGDIPKPLRIADDWETVKVIRPTLGKRLGLSVVAIKSLTEAMAATWESLKEGENQTPPEERARFISGWQEHRLVFGYTLLAELPYALKEAMHSHSDLKGLDIDVLVVDEYQDLNACELAVLHQLADRGCRLLAAGDADQSIYSWRKAAPEGIWRFPKDYPGSDNYTLTATQRCSRRIVRWANYVIAGDLSRPPDAKPLVPDERAPDGEVALLSFAGEAAEPKGIASLVEQLASKEGVPYGEILILLRADKSGRFSTPIKNQLEKHKIPVSDPDAVQRLLEEDGHRFLIEFFRLRANPSDSISWASLLVLTTKISMDFVHLVYERARVTRATFAEALLDFKESGFPDAPTTSANRARTLIEDVQKSLEQLQLPEEMPKEGWGSWIVAQARTIDIVPDPGDELVDLLARVDAVLDDPGDLGRYLGQIAPLGKDLAQAEGDGVRIMTMSGAKGFTVRATIVAAAENGVVPLASGDLSEERRLLYVAMTRAREFLYCTWARTRKGQTARSGSGKTNEKRKHSHFFDGGPVVSEDGPKYITTRWGD